MAGGAEGRIRVGIVDRLFKRTPPSDNDRVALVYVDAENAQAIPDSIRSTITEHFGGNAKHMFAYSKWSANSPISKKFRNAGFRLMQADSGENNADIMMSLDAYEQVRDLAERGISGEVYICFHGDRGFTHLLERIKAVSGWRSVWVTSNNKRATMIENSASEVLYIPKVSGKATLTKAKPVAVAKPSRAKKPSPENLETFRSELLKALSEPTSMAKFQTLFALSLNKNGYDGMSAKQFAVHCGIPKSWTLIKAIETHLADAVTVKGSGNSAVLSPRTNVVTTSSARTG